MAQTPGFVWDARISAAPLMHVRVRDAYVGAEASGDVTLMSLVAMGHETGAPELSSGALHRYLAEAVWYPTALLPEAGVTWEAVDETRADAGISVSLEFRFNDAGEVIGINTDKRYGLFDGSYTQYPWEGRFRDYQTRNGVKIPTYGEVGWLLPDGWWLFWQGNIREAVYSY